MVVVVGILWAGSVFAAVPFESYFGTYKITSCELTLDEQTVPNDPECGYSHIQVAKDARGVVRITRSTDAGSSVGEPVEVFDWQQNGFSESATFSTYENYQVWQHTLAYPDGQLSQAIEITDFAFNTDQTKKITFSVSKSVQNRTGNSSSRRVFSLVAE
jgi:hypothetical protein